MPIPSAALPSRFPTIDTIGRSACSCFAMRQTICGSNRSRVSSTMITSETTLEVSGFDHDRQLQNKTAQLYWSRPK